MIAGGVTAGPCIQQKGSHNMFCGNLPVDELVNMYEAERITQILCTVVCVSELTGKHTSNKQRPSVAHYVAVSQAQSIHPVLRASGLGFGLL